MKDKISINAHSSIRIASGKTLYFDPFKITDEAHDADIIFITHEHFDHFSPEDIAKLARPDTLFVLPESMKEKAVTAGIAASSITAVVPNASYTVSGVSFEAVPAYNAGKPFHPQANNWVGYLVTVDGQRVYVCGDTDALPENTKLSCDILIVPVGGTYTMTAVEAAEFANSIHPAIAIPSHYGAITGTPEDGLTFAGALDTGIHCEILIQ